MPAGEKYTNSEKQYTSYFLSFEEGTTRLELIHRPDISPAPGQRGFQKGIAHFTISLGEKEKVTELTEILRNDHFTIYSEPRTTGDGYYETVVMDPEGNILEEESELYWARTSDLCSVKAAL